MTDYSRALKGFRIEADNFDFDAYLKDEENGMFDEVTKEAGLADLREGLMGRRIQKAPKPEEPPMSLGRIARRFIEIRKKRMNMGKSSTPSTPTKERGGEGFISRHGGKGFLKRPTSKDGSFKQLMMQSESSNKTDSQITIDDGRTMTGGYHFGDARLADAMKGLKIKFTTEEFRKDPALQEVVMDWHIADIDKEIKKLDTDLSRDGLRAVAHLGGKGGMAKFVRSKGKHNPKDKFGTSLQDYFDKFA